MKVDVSPTHADLIALHKTMLDWGAINQRYQTTFLINGECRGANGSLLEVLRWLQGQGWLTCVDPKDKFRLTMDENQAFAFRMRWS